MPELTAPVAAYIEIAFADRPNETVPITQLPFFIGRGRENGNHLSIDDMRVSRRSVVISQASGGPRVEDNGQREGIFVNGEPTSAQTLADGDRIRLGTDESCQLVFRLPPRPIVQEDAETKLRSIMGSLSSEPGGNNSAEELNGLKLLLEATSLMHSQLPLQSVLAAMLDHAIVITNADRGMLLEPDASGTLQVKIARGRKGEVLASAAMNPSRSVLGSAIELQSAVVNEDLNLAEVNVQSAESVVMQLLRSSVVVPLYCAGRGGDGPVGTARRELLGAVYLDSKRTATFSALDRQILDALGAQAGGILENARLIERERERQRLEQELSIAREIQQASVPHGLQEHPHFSIAGMLRPCDEVGGDYFDVFRLPDGRLALLIADVAGKGLGAALVTTMLQGALSGMTLGVDPVKVFNHLNQFLCDRASVARCATMFFGLLDPNGNLEFLRAGHPAPLLMRRGNVSELYSDGSLPIGLAEDETYESSSVQLEPGDTLLLYTDGVTEAEDVERNLFQDTGLKEVFAQHQHSSLKQLQDGTFAAIEKFATARNSRTTLRFWWCDTAAETMKAPTLPEVVRGPIGTSRRYLRVPRGNTLQPRRPLLSGLGLQRYLSFGRTWPSAQGHRSISAGPVKHKPFAFQGGQGESSGEAHHVHSLVRSSPDPSVFGFGTLLHKFEGLLASQSM